MSSASPAVATYALNVMGTVLCSFEVFALGDFAAAAYQSPSSSSSSAFILIDNIPSIVLLADVLNFIEPFLDHVRHAKCIAPVVHHLHQSSSPSQITSCGTYSLLCEVCDFTSAAGETDLDHHPHHAHHAGFSLEKYLASFNEECHGHPLTALHPSVTLRLSRVVSSEAIIRIVRSEEEAASADGDEIFRISLPELVSGSDEGGDEGIHSEKESASASIEETHQTPAEEEGGAGGVGVPSPKSAAVRGVGRGPSPLLLHQQHFIHNVTSPPPPALPLPTSAYPVKDAGTANTSEGPFAPDSPNRANKSVGGDDAHGDDDSRHHNAHATVDDAVGSAAEQTPQEQKTHASLPLPPPPPPPPPQQSSAMTTCCICLEALGTVPCVTTLCSHQFHIHCHAKVGPMCPLCRFELSSLGLYQRAHPSSYHRSLRSSAAVTFAADGTAEGGVGDGESSAPPPQHRSEHNTSVDSSSIHDHDLSSLRFSSVRRVPSLSSLTFGAGGGRRISSVHNSHDARVPSSVATIPSRSTLREIFNRAAFTGSTGMKDGGGRPSREVSAAGEETDDDDDDDDNAVGERSGARRNSLTSSRRVAMGGSRRDYGVAMPHQQDVRCDMCERLSLGGEGRNVTTGGAALPADNDHADNISTNAVDASLSSASQIPTVVSSAPNRIRHAVVNKPPVITANTAALSPLPAAAGVVQRSFWMCLVCGATHGCRDSCNHARAHYEATGHRFAVDVHAPRVWDFRSEAYVHRLVQQLEAVAEARQQRTSDNDVSGKEAAPTPPPSSQANTDNHKNTTPARHEDTVSFWVDYGFNDEEERARLLSSVDFVAEFYSKLLEDQLRAQAAYYQTQIDAAAGKVKMERLLAVEAKGRRAIVAQWNALFVHGIAAAATAHSGSHSSPSPSPQEKGRGVTASGGASFIIAKLKEEEAKNKAKGRQIITKGSSGGANGNAAAPPLSSSSAPSVAVEATTSEDAGLATNRVTLEAAKANLAAVLVMKEGLLSRAKVNTHTRFVSEKDAEIAALQKKLEALYAQL